MWQSVTRCNSTIAVLSILIAACSGSKIPPDGAPQTATAERSYTNAIERSRAAITPLLTEYPALTAAVAVDGRLVWSEGRGWADVDSKRPATAATRFRIYSTSKSITAALAMRLAEEKQVDLDAPVSRYLPDLPAALSSVTLRQLLLHRGGVRHYREGEWLSVSRDRCTTARDALRPFINDPLIAPPDTKYNYSSFGYVLASAVLEAAASRPFYDLLADEILAPAGMKSTAVEYRASALAQPYDKDGSGVSVAVNADNSCKFGAGGLVGTSEDLVRFGVALLDGRLVSAESLSAMLNGQPTAPGRPDYGLGFTLENDPRIGAFATHSGGALGGRSFLLMSRDRRIVVALAGNLEGSSLRNPAVDIAAAFASP